MATQVMGQASGGAGLFPSSGNMGMALPNDMYDLHDLSKAELAAPQLIMLANVALTGEVSGSCCDYLVVVLAGLPWCPELIQNVYPCCFFFFFPGDGVSLCSQAGLDLCRYGWPQTLAILPQPSACWDAW
uniref:RE1-silencing transcription factor n=1 Tax=Chinchilla lanigera TaxID=34839 RepID=A0A8C2UVW5_CHILA